MKAFNYFKELYILLWRCRWLIFAEASFIQEHFQSLLKLQSCRKAQTLQRSFHSSTKAFVHYKILFCDKIHLKILLNIEGREIVFFNISKYFFHVKAMPLEIFSRQEAITSLSAGAKFNGHKDSFEKSPSKFNYHSTRGGFPNEMLCNESFYFVVSRWSRFLGVYFAIQMFLMWVGVYVWKRERER